MPFKVKVPDSCADLCPAKVERMLEKHFGDITAAARELGVSGPDLRRLTWAQPNLYINALEELELVVSCAQDELIQALDSDDWRRRAWGAERILSSYIARDDPLSLAPRRATRVQSSGAVSLTFKWAEPSARPVTDGGDANGKLE